MSLSFQKSSRSRVLATGLLVLVVIFVGQLFNLQILQHAHYREEAEKEQVARLTIPAKRGKVYAHDGQNLVPLVLNEPVYTAYADPHEVEDPRKISEVIRRIAGGTVVKDFEDGLTSKQSRYTVLARQLTRKQAELLKKEEIAGVGLQESDRRVYPEGSLAAQLLGYVNSEGKGQYGIEEAANDRLKGEDGLLQAVTDVRRIPLTIGREDIRKPAKNGDDLVLTIDRNIQAYAETALEVGLKRAGATKGSVIVMDPKTAAVKAMANFPTYNPEKYYEVEDYRLFQNNVVSEPYEAGSVIKALTVGVGLDTGVVTPHTTFNNPGFVKVEDRIIRNVEEDPISPAATMTDILQYSLNTGVVFIMQQLGDGSYNRKARNVIYDYFTNHYMFGKKTGIEQAAESRGVVIPPTDVQGNNVRYANMTFGQGMDLTMVQVAAAFSAAVNGGTYYKPHLIAGTRSADGAVKQETPKVVKQNVLKPEVSTTLRDMIYRARQAGVLGGNDRGYFVGGKTGTSEIIDPATGRYTDANSIGSYVGFGGDTEPKYVIMVQVKDSKLPGYAGTTAAGPIFTDISNWMIDYMKLKARGN
ncbi:MAG TPA: penicillin-binding protein 2 [Verrucomicrobiae bacterium]|nr:penicillin-binding protein 2 [Verrucomicrobiae bacterium]